MDQQTQEELFRAICYLREVGAVGILQDILEAVIAAQLAAIGERPAEPRRVFVEARPAAQFRLIG
ncbi:MAG: hypothetical protein EHM35_00395 [Planctomycetaceae bacterium]|nr:MAG: hypothetical protein EHM35_00395 [Planctomycetaceae bacterium]